MSDVFILETLQNATKAAVAASIVATLPIKFEGRTFVPTEEAADGKYLELRFIPSNRTDDFWGDAKNFQGMFRFILHWPKDDAGAYDPMNVLQSIIGYFTKGALYDGVQLTTLPDVQASLENDDETLYPASARYQYFSR